MQNQTVQFCHTEISVNVFGCGLYSVLHRNRQSHHPAMQQHADVSRGPHWAVSRERGLGLRQVWMRVTAQLLVAAE